MFSNSLGSSQYTDAVLVIRDYRDKEKVSIIEIPMFEKTMEVSLMKLVQDHPDNSDMTAEFVVAWIRSSIASIHWPLTNVLVIVTV